MSRMPQRIACLTEAPVLPGRGNGPKNLSYSPQRRKDAKIAKEIKGYRVLAIHPLGD
jgi:hypothetical protein